MITFPYYNNHSSVGYDFGKTSDNLTKSYEQIRELVAWATKVKRWFARMLSMPLAFCIIMTGAVLFIIPSLVVLLLLKAENRSLGKSVKRENLEVRKGYSYLVIREHLEDTNLRLAKIKSIYALLQTKHNIILRAQFLKEFEQSIRLIEACVDAYTKALQVYDTPLLGKFEDLVKKEKELWDNRTKAYDYML